MAGEIRENFNGYVFQDGRCVSIEDVDTICEEIVSKVGERGKICGILRGLVDECLNAGLLKAALAYLEKETSITDDPQGLAKIHLTAGTVFERMGDHDSAVQRYKAGLALPKGDDHTWYFLHNNLGYCLNILGLFDEAEKYCRAAIEIDERRYTYDPTTGVRVAADNGYVLTYRSGVGNLVKTDASGNVQWQRTFSGGGSTDSYSVDLTSDGGYILAGGRSSNGGDLWLAKTDSSGNLLWEKMFGGTGFEVGRSVRQTSDNGFVVAGYSNSGGSGGEDIYLVRTDASGMLLWEKWFGGTGEDRGYGVMPTADGGFAVAGRWTPVGSTSFRPVILKTDSYGNIP